MKFKIPFKITLMGFPILTQMKCKELEYAQDAGGSDIGMGIIKIAPNLCEYQERATYVHENLHFLNALLTLGLTEEEIERLSYGLMEFIEQLEWIDNDEPKSRDTISNP